MAAVRDFYRRALSLLRNAQVPFLIGGGYAMEIYTELSRHTKDIDLFVLPELVPHALDTLARGGYRTEVCDEDWLAKAADGEEYVDIIFNSSNRFSPVDPEWFKHAIDAKVLGMPVKLCPVEEIIWQKAFVMARDRYDGADVAHLLRVRGDHLDWDRLLRRFGAHWRVLLSHLILFEYIYPDEPSARAREVQRRLLEREEAELEPVPVVAAKRCYGMLLGPAEYRIDAEEWGYEDPRPPRRAPVETGI